MTNATDRRTRARGFSLLEVLITVAIIALVSGAIAIAVVKQSDKAKLTSAGTEARTIRTAAQLFRSQSESDSCPSVEDLVAAGELDRSARRKDPWGGGYRVRCTPREVIVASAGPDKKDGTPDDIRVPSEEEPP